MDASKLPTYPETLPSGRPQICFMAWGPIPEDYDITLRVGQTGFHLANDGIAAHEISIEDFEIEPGVWAAGETISRIREKADGFAVVWRKGLPGFATCTEKWDLLGHMAAAAAKRPASEITQIDYHVRVGATYRDGLNVWYRSHADLIYIPTQRRLKFGPTTHEKRETNPEPEAFPELAEGPPDSDNRPATETNVSTEAASSAASDECRNFTSEAERIDAVVAYTKSWPCSEAALARTARVDPADLSKWKKGRLPIESAKKARIEKALKNNEAPTPSAKRPKRFQVSAEAYKYRQRWR
jgi:hypothetical protein